MLQKFNFIIIILFLAYLLPAVEPEAYINMHLGGRLGNQMFQVACALSLAKDTGARAIFPDFATKNGDDLPLNYSVLFSSLDTTLPNHAPCAVFSEHPHFHFTPIPYQPNMEVSGYFQSERYFKHNKEIIHSFFKPPATIVRYLEEKYQNLLCHPCTVAIHMRAYKLESPDIEKCFPFLTRAYYQKAATLFPDDALFVIFSDRIDWAKQEMGNFSRPHLFIENESHFHDLYLMSFCKHQIISPSSFSWWAAYLNTNPYKIVVAPTPWFSPCSGHDSSNVIPPEWSTLSWEK